MNPIIKFTTLFGLLAVELAIKMDLAWRLGLAALFLAVALVFVYRSFYGMRIESGVKAAEGAGAASPAH
jgi:K(+)-stimulated pyrophosphate-energized sodium pump